MERSLAHSLFLDSQTANKFPIHPSTCILKLNVLNYKNIPVVNMKLELMKLAVLKDVNLCGCVEQICSGKLPDRTMLVFARLCIRVTCGYLKYLQGRGYRLTQSNCSDSDLELMAADTIADLFQRNDSDELIHFKAYFSQFLETTNTNAQWLIVLRGLIASRVQQSMMRIFKERDPISAKIIRSIRLNASERNDLLIKKRLQVDQIHFLKKTNIAQETTRVSLDLDGYHIRRDCFEAFHPQDNIPTLIEKTKEALNNRFGLPCELPLLELARLFKTYRTGQNAQKIREQSFSLNDGENKLEHAELKQVLDTIHERLAHRIDHKYVANGKLDAPTAHALKLALQALIQDMLEQGHTEPFYEYMKRFAPDMNPKEYRIRFRKIFEYFFRILKQEIRQEVPSFSEIP